MPNSPPNSTPARRTRAKRQRVKALSADALKQNNESFLKLAQATLEKYQDGPRMTSPPASSPSRRWSSRSRSPWKSGCENRRDREGAGHCYGQLRNNEIARHRQLSLQVEAPNFPGSALHHDGRHLGETAAAARGRDVGMTAYCDFTEQQTAGVFRPDLVVRLPGGSRS